MKKVIFLLDCILIINSINCFSQAKEKSKKEFKSETNFVCGYSNEINDPLSRGITFGKVFSLADTTYYIKFDLYSPNSEYRTDICLSRESEVSFIAKSGKSVDLKLTEVGYKRNSDEQINSTRSPNKVYCHSTTLIFEVTKEELIKIGSDPFYRLILPYFNCSSKVYNKVVFFKPALFTSRIFTQKNINYILDI